jgi:integrase
MSVRKRKWTTRAGEVKEAWVVDYVDQEGDRHIKTFDKKKDADAYAAQTGVDVRAGTHTAASKSITVAKAVDDWINESIANGLERSTVAQYQQHAKHINARMGSLKIANLTTYRVKQFRIDLTTASDEFPNAMSKALARKVLTSLKSILSVAQENGRVAQNVALALDNRRKRRHGTTNRNEKKKLVVGVDIPTPAEIKQIIASANTSGACALSC